MPGNVTHHGIDVVKVKGGKETQDHTTFHKELLPKCQHEFEKDKKDDEEHEKMLTAIDEASTAEEKQDLKEKIKAWRTKAGQWATCTSLGRSSTSKCCQSQSCMNASIVCRVQSQTKTLSSTSVC